MEGLALVLLAAAPMIACAPRTCDPQPLPEEYKEVGPLLPASAVVCGKYELGDALSLTFKERDVKELALETNALLTAAGWTVAKSSNFDRGYVVAAKGSANASELSISINIDSPKSGRVTGRVSLFRHD